MLVGKFASSNEPLVKSLRASHIAFTKSLHACCAAGAASLWATSVNDGGCHSAENRPAEIRHSARSEVLLIRRRDAAVY